MKRTKVEKLVKHSINKYKKAYKMLAKEKK